MDANSFDSLSKRLGSTSSRRHSIRALFGLALLGTSHAPLPEIEPAEARRRKRKQQKSVGQNPVADTVLLGEGSPEIEGELFDPCPERVSRPGYTPSLNGCGSDFFDVPDSNVFSDKTVSFTAACNEHDKCYGTCNSDRDLCDLRLAADMEKACDGVYLKQGKKKKKRKKGKKFESRSDSRQHQRCLDQTDIYWATLKSVGWKAYNDAQEDACICCKAGEIACKDKCVNTQTDRNNCGACGQVCPGGQDCVLGSCSGVEYEFELEWPFEDIAGHSFPICIAVSPDGQFIYVGDSQTIRKYSPQGALINVFQLPDYVQRVWSVSVDRDGFIYATTPNYDLVTKLHPNGSVEKIFKGYDDEDVPGVFVEKLKNPFEVSVDGSGNIYVGLSPSGPDDIALLKMSQDGSVLTSWTDAEVVGVRSVATDADGEVYISSDDRFQKFAADGSGVRTWEHPMSCEGLAVDQSNGRVFAMDFYGGVVVFDGAGNIVTSWGQAGTGPGEFDEADGIAVDPDGTVYVADTGNHRIQKFRRVQTRA